MDDPQITQAQVNAIEAVLVAVHNWREPYSFVSVAHEARRANGALLEPLDEGDLCAAITAIWDHQIKFLELKQADVATKALIARMKRNRGRQ